MHLVPDVPCMCQKACLDVHRHAASNACLVVTSLCMVGVMVYLMAAWLQIKDKLF
jgi:hypothetical protein